MSSSLGSSSLRGSLGLGGLSGGRSISAGAAGKLGDVFANSKYEGDFSTGGSGLSRALSVDRDIGMSAKDPIYIGDREEVILGYAKIRTPDVSFRDSHQHVSLQRGVSPSPARVPRQYYESEDFGLNDVDDHRIPRARTRVSRYSAHSRADLDDYDDMPRVRLEPQKYGGGRMYRSSSVCPESRSSSFLSEGRSTSIRSEGRSSSIRSEGRSPSYRPSGLNRRDSMEDLEFSIDRSRNRSRTPMRSTSYSHIRAHGQVDQGAIEREVRARRSASMCRVDDDNDDYIPVRARNSVMGLTRRSMSRSRSVGPRDFGSNQHDSFIYSTADSFKPSDIHMVVLPSGKKAVTHTRLAMPGFGGRDDRMDLDALAFRTRHLQSTIHSLEDFVRRNRSLFPEETMIEQSLSLYRLPEQQLRHIGASTDAEIYGCKVREKLIVPHGSDVTSILMKHYGKKNDFDIEYRDHDHLRKHIKTVQSLDEEQMRLNFRKQVEDEFERKRPRRGLDDSRKEYESRRDRLTNDYIKSVYANSGLDYDSLYSRRSSVDRLSSTDQEPSGRSQTRKKKKVFDSSPAFTAKLRPKRCSEGHSVRFNCSVSGMPAPDVTWYKGNRMIGGGRFNITNEYGLCSLEISKVKKDDEGQITAKATNSEGEVSCSATLEVVDGEGEGRARPKLACKPSFMVEAHNAWAQIGQRAVLEAAATGSPMPTFKWMKDNYTVFDTERITVYSDDLGNTKLSIRQLKPDDAGLYFCVAENDHGKAKCAATLRVVGKDQFHEHERKQSDVADIKPKEYTPFKLREWSPTRRREHSPGKTREFSPISRRKFAPADLEFDDDNFGFERPSGSKREPREPMEVESEPITSESRPTQENAAPGKKKGSKPRFVQVPPAEISVHEGEPLTLRCVVDGEPRPIGRLFGRQGMLHLIMLFCLVTWHKGARELIYTNRHRVLNDGDSFMMQIKSTLSTDHGEFTVEAENEFGKIRGTIWVKILPPREEEDDEELERKKMEFEIERGKMPPMFIKRLPREREIHEGDDLEIGCIIEEVKTRESVRPKQPSDVTDGETPEPVPVAEEDIAPTKKAPVEEKAPQAEEQEKKPTDSDKKAAEVIAETLLAQATADAEKVMKEEKPEEEEPEVVEEPIKKEEKAPKEEQAPASKDEPAEEPHITDENKPAEESAKPVEAPSKEQVESSSEEPMTKAEEPKEDAEPKVEEKQPVEEPAIEEPKKKSKKDKEPKQEDSVDEPATEEPKKKSKKDKEPKKEDSVDEPATEEPKKKSKKDKEPKKEDSVDEPATEEPKKKSKKDKEPKKEDSVDEPATEEPKKKSKKDKEPKKEDSVDEPATEEPKKKSKKDKEPKKEDSVDEPATEEPKKKSKKDKEPKKEDSVDEPATEEPKKKSKKDKEPKKEDSVDEPATEEPKKKSKKDKEPKKEDSVDEPATEEPKKKSKKDKEPKKEDSVDEPATEEPKKKSKKDKEPKKEDSVDEPATEEPKKEEAPIEEDMVQKVETPNKETPKEETPKEEAPKEEAPIEEEAVQKVEAPKEEAPKEEAPIEEEAVQKVEAPKEEAPKEEAPKEEAPKQEAPKEEAPKEECEISKEDGAQRYSLEIYEFNMEDRGEYSVTAKNPLQTVKSKCIVNMLGAEPFEVPSEESKPESPAFENPDHPIEVRFEEDNAILECVLKSVAETICKWMKNDKEIKTSDKFQMVTEKSVVRLIIVGLKPEDAGDYTLSAVNPAGTLKATAPLKGETALTYHQQLHEFGSPYLVPVKAAPKFEEPVQIKFEENLVNFEFKLATTKDAQIKWTRNGGDIVDSDKYKLTEDNGVYRLTVFNVEPSTDAGDYLLTVVSPGGTLKCTATLDIKAPEKIVPAPKFEEPVQICLEENAAKFEFKMVSNEENKITWSRNGEEIKESKKYKMTSGSDGKCSLVVFDLDPATDAGDYLLHIANPGGNLKCTASLEIEAPEKKPPPPTFEKPLSIDFDGSSANFSCKIASEADVTVVWMRNEEEIKESGKYKISSADAGVYTLTVCDVDAATDAGDYVLVASSSGGKLKCTATLDIEPPEERPPAPTFEKPVQISIEGNSAKFECQLNASEDTVVSWSRKGNDLSNSDKYELKSEKSVYSLTVLNVDAASDAGDYLFTAKNAGGSLKCTASLSVQEPEARPPAPSFEKPVQISFDGEAARFECKLNMTEDTTLTWSYKGAELESSDKYVLGSEGGVVSLTVQNVDPESDAGDYVLTAVNPGGKLTCTASLNIEVEEETESEEESSEEEESEEEESEEEESEEEESEEEESEEEESEEED
ncbi:hypothetical protein CAPTEDRAFT_227990 [Capitella teleta]|uniref:Ig-like domain-containing protein n=1 Tax=Capitella teleta TaxID=283909 RepID=R7TQ54_CAPTE|nr:hypothetical protein CAPTEDRAFT_227990 [Capitella teleta]|eukprot:ELT96028.1 hypothetical protein CAPTEDRAFT_227990 [Capitella teleta]